MQRAGVRHGTAHAATHVGHVGQVADATAAAADVDVVVVVVDRVERRAGDLRGRVGARRGRQGAHATAVHTGVLESVGGRGILKTSRNYIGIKKRVLLDQMQSE